MLWLDLRSWWPTFALVRIFERFRLPHELVFGRQPRINRLYASSATHQRVSTMEATLQSCLRAIYVTARHKTSILSHFRFDLVFELGLTNSLRAQASACVNEGKTRASARNRAWTTTGLNTVRCTRRKSRTTCSLLARMLAVQMPVPRAARAVSKRRQTVSTSAARFELKTRSVLTLVVQKCFNGSRRSHVAQSHLSRARRSS
jgi:hypothetical protein